MFKKFHWKITSMFFVLFLISLLTAGEFLSPKLQKYFVENEKKHMNTSSTIIANIVSPLVYEGKERDLQEKVVSLSRANNLRLTIIDSRGKVLGESMYSINEMDNHFDRVEVQEALKGNHFSVIRFSDTAQKDMLYTAVPMYHRQQIIGVVRVSVPMEAVFAMVIDIKRKLIGSVGAVLLLSTMIAFYFAGRFTKPIRDLTTFAEEVAKGNFTKPVRVETSDELNYLAESLSNMAGRLSENILEISVEKNKIKAILASLVDGVIAVDLEGRIILMNHAAERMFKRKEKHALGKYILRLIRNTQVENLVDQVLKEGQPIVEELRLSPQVGPILKIQGTPITTQDKSLTGVVLVLRDVTKIRLLEQMRTEFVANVSHELKTPLTSIKGFVETLLDGAMEDPKTSRRFLGIINEESNRLSRLIEDILSLARIEAPAYEFETEPTNFLAVVNKQKDLLSPMALEKQIDLSVKVPENLPRVLIDSDPLEQVIVNLLENAIKYTPAGGSVELEVLPEEDHLLVQIKDTGIGIPKEAIPRLFERFYRVDKARSRDVGGTGLGLSIVKHILEKHGERIWVESELGEGSIFTFTLKTES